MMIAQLGHLICKRLLLGVCHASHDAAYCVGRPVVDYPYVPDRADYTELAVGEFAVLGWCGGGGSFVSFYQP